MKKIGNSSIFYEKYKPQCIEDVILPETLKQSLIIQIQNKDIKNIGLFSDTPGTGKSTLAEVLLKEKEFKNLVLSIFRNTKTINIFLERNKENGYQSFGRNQTEDQAVQLDYKILKLLIDNNIDFYRIKSDENTVQKILEIIKEKEK